MKINNSFFLCLAISLLVWSCKNKDNRPVEVRYQEALEKGISSTERTDDLLLGISFGMNRKEFFDHCTGLNKRRMIKEGDAGATVLYHVKELEHEGKMNFFPKFKVNDVDSTQLATIYALDMEFIYDSYAVWNEELHAIPLLRDVTRVMIEWYGDDFMAVPHERVGRVVTQVKNNRRISLWVKGDGVVQGRMVDLSVVPDEPLISKSLTIPAFLDKENE